MGLWKTTERGKKDKKGQIKCSTDQCDISQFGLSVAIKKTKNSGCLCAVISSNCD